jgi:phage shock protein E
MSRKNPIIIDVREPEEFAAGHVKGALNLPLSKLSDDSTQLKDIPKSAKVVLYCNTGRRSGLAMDVLNRLGYKDVVNAVSQEQTEQKYT